MDEVKAFFESKNEIVQSLLADLSCFCNVTQKLNILDLELQGGDKHVADMISTENSLKVNYYFGNRILIKEIADASKCGKNYQEK
jgi:hypothetical protein